jgi:hypothetical protein
MAVEWLFLFWFTPVAYTAMTVGGQIAYRWNKKRLGNRGGIGRVVYPHALARVQQSLSGAHYV